MKLEQLLKVMNKHNASDLHLQTGSPPTLRIDGQLNAVDSPPLTAEEVAEVVYSMLDEVKREADYVTPHSGGDGALRDAVEYILKAQGKWKQVVGQYISERSPKKSGQ